MSTYVNNRRKAINSVSTTKTNEVSARSFSDKRRAMIPSLSQHWKERLELFKDKFHNTEKDVYMVFECQPTKSGRASLENDVPPTLVVDQVIAIDQRNDTLFHLPVIAVQESNWLEALPKFETWLIQRCRYPQQSLDGKTIRPATTVNQIIKNVSNVDRIETYMAAFHGTLMEYFFKGNQSHLRSAYQIYLTMSYMIQRDAHKDPKPMENDALVTEYQRLLTQRDSSYEAACAFKKWVSELSPSQYFEVLLNTLVTQPQLTHKSQIVNSEVLTWGLLVGVNRAQDTLRESWLRLLLERGLQKSSLPTDAKCVSIEELTEYCHHKMGPRLLNVLRQGAFQVNVLEVINRPGQLTLASFEQEVKWWREQVIGVKELTSLCMLVSPQTEINNELLAEIWLHYCDQKQSFQILTMESLHLETYPKMTSMVQLTCEKLQKLKDIIEAAEQPIVLADPNPHPNPDVSKNVDGKEVDQAVDKVAVVEVVEVANQENTQLQVMANRLAQDKIKNNWSNRIQCTEDWIPMFSYLFAQSRKGSTESIPYVQYLINHLPVNVARRRVLMFVIRATEKNSPLYKELTKTRPIHFSNILAVPVENSRRALNRFLLQCKRSVDGNVASRLQQAAREKSAQPVQSVKKVIAADDDKEDLNHEPILFVPFEWARQKVAAMRKKANDVVIEVECPVCFEQTALHPLHKEPRHAVCIKCVSLLSTCPFCRIQL